MSASLELVWVDFYGKEHSQTFDNFEEMTKDGFESLRVSGWVNDVKMTIEVDQDQVRDCQIMVKRNE